ncbi:tetratricopeptide repeat protein [bacterium SCSIO 12741]|nr:tetratricopeptide repeat protein [bacterium SCSIO 12741]
MKERGEFMHPIEKRGVTMLNLTWMTKLLFIGIVQILLISCSNKTEVRQLNELGFSQYNSEEYEKAILTFSVALELDEKSHESYNGRALAKKAMGRTKEALSDYDRAIQILEDTVYLNSRAKAKFDLDDLEGAVSDYSRCLELNPNYYLPCRYPKK